MAEIRVIENHALSPSDAIGCVSGFEDMLTKYGVKTKWKGHSAQLKGMAVSGSIDVTSSSVTVVVKLGMMARAAGVDPARLEKSIRKRLKAALSGEPEG